jgi:hypothetical protein
LFPGFAAGTADEIAVKVLDKSTIISQSMTKQVSSSRIFCGFIIRLKI